ncbi:MAG: chemotaxis protein CheW [Candidatus Latescibacteria bacterium]|nr:chemotaxis protein CheW [Candidatus Latescibacterota bacterium]
MSARFKSPDSYFKNKSGLTKQVLRVPVKKSARKHAAVALPLALLRDRFCSTAERFRIDEEGTFVTGIGASFDIDDALERHLSGDATVSVDPVSSSGLTAWHAVVFDIAASIDHPFSKAREYAGMLEKRGIGTLLEVGEGGKGHYRVWIFHQTPVPSSATADALARLGESLFGFTVAVQPAADAETGEFVTLPFQGESMLLQRGVLVNSVGKKIKDQRAALESAEPCPASVLESLIGDFDSVPEAKDKETGAAPETAENAARSETPAEPEPVVIETAAAGLPSGFLAATVAGIPYAFDAAAVDRVYAEDALRRFPFPSGSCIGSLRTENEHVPVFDARSILAGTSESSTSPQKVILFNVSRGLFGLAVDDVCGFERSPTVLSFERLAGDAPVAGIPHLKDSGGKRLVLADIDSIPNICFDDMGSRAQMAGVEADYLLFTISGVTFGLDLKNVREILMKTPADGEGNEILYRGKRIEFIDGAGRIPLKRPNAIKSDEASLSLSTRIIVAKDKSTPYAVSVESIIGVERLSGSSLCPVSGADAVRYAGIVQGAESEVFIVGSFL